MSNKVLLEPNCPVTQTAKAVKSLITCHNLSHEPHETAAFYEHTLEDALSHIDEVAGPCTPE